MTYNVIGGTLNLAQLNSTSSYMAQLTLHLLQVLMSKCLGLL